jgi:hypothetical protein
MTDTPAKFTIVDRRNLEDDAAVEAPVTPDGITPAALDGAVSVHELYACGLPVGAFADIAPNTALLLPLRRPAKSTGGIVTAVDEVKGTLGTACVAYVVAGLGAEHASADQHPQTWTNVNPGDVVVVRNAMLEPLHPDLEPLSIHRRHILAVIRLRDELIEG